MDVGVAALGKELDGNGEAYAIGFVLQVGHFGFHSCEGSFTDGDLDAIADSVLNGANLQLVAKLHAGIDEAVHHLLADRHFLADAERGNFCAQIRSISILSGILKMHML